jgi:phosphohistidine phosphatase
MILTIWRHGEAGRAPRDDERALTDRGCDDVGFGAQRFHDHLAARQLPNPDSILFSPWIRTRQTADIISAAFTHATSATEKGIQPGAGQADALQLVQSVLDEGATEHLLLVSHQPLVSQLIDSLLGDAGKVPSLSPGGLAVLDLEIAGPGAASLVLWSLPPEYGAGA